MKKLLVSSILVFILVIASIALVMANGGPGSIWTTTENCGEDPQNENPYALGQKVFINGANFNPGTYDWTITGAGGENSEASCDPGAIVASGNYTVDSSGAFCFEAYTINFDDCGVYKVDFNGKKDNYHVDLSLPPVPEFGTIIGALTILSAIGAFFVIRRR